MPENSEADDTSNFTLFIFSFFADSSVHSFQNLKSVDYLVSVVIKGGNYLIILSQANNCEIKSFVLLA
jgi:hypothetical protein